MSRTKITKSSSRPERTHEHVHSVLVGYYPGAKEGEEPVAMPKEREEHQEMMLWKMTEVLWTVCYLMQRKRWVGEGMHYHLDARKGSRLFCSLLRTDRG